MATPGQSRPARTTVLPLLILLSVSSTVGAASTPTPTTSIERRSFFVPLAPTATPLPLLARPSESAPQGLTFTLLLPQTQQNDTTTKSPPRPLIFLLNGANVEARWYGQLAGALAAGGYPVALSDAYRRVPQPYRSTNSSNSASCPGPKFALAPSAGALQSLLKAADDPTFATTPATMALLSNGLRLRERGVVLLGHSFGGAVSSLLLGGRCVPKQQQQKNATVTTTTTPKNSNSTSPLQSSIDEFAFLCGGWQPSPRDLALLRGAVLLEGYPSSPAPSSSSAGFSPAGIDLTARREAGLRAVESGGGGGGGGAKAATINPFVLFLQGEFNGRVRAAYDASVGLVSSGGNNTNNSTCVAYARFRGLNHYLGTDWVEPAQVGGGGGGGQNASTTNNNSTTSRQITPCGAPASNDPASFTVTKQTQEKGTKRIAALIDAVVRAQVFGDSGAERTLGGWVGSGANATTTPVDVPPGDTAELLHAGGGCRFGGGTKR